MTEKYILELNSKEEIEHVRVALEETDQEGHTDIIDRLNELSMQADGHKPIAETAASTD